MYTHMPIFAEFSMYVVWFSSVPFSASHEMKLTLHSLKKLLFFYSNFLGHLKSSFSTNTSQSIIFQDLKFVYNGS